MKEDLIDANFLLRYFTGRRCQQLFQEVMDKRLSLSSSSLRGSKTRVDFELTGQKPGLV
ncbi:MAG: hypothetical protein KF760_13135 [Candidatus Eremiobacteraeota bacterium]|nr:hypothetical protein [Candidatus Eremiobacteraeota bacterium]MCW5867011.1 hypothetical protein [Candidatus Eremiobacteraeota bacterium]